MNAPRPHVVHPLPGCSLTSAVIEAGRVTTEPVVVCPPGTDPPGSVADLLGDTALGIGAVVPRCRRRAADHGTLRPSAPLRHDVTAAVSRTMVAVRPEVAASTRVPADVDDPASVVAALVARAAELGQRVVEDDTWLAPDEPADLDQSASAGDAHILLVTGFVPGDPLRSEDRAVLALLDDLLDQTGDVTITLLAVDGFRAEPSAEALRRLGVTVVTGPVDWPVWFGERVLAYSNIVVTWSGLQSDVRSWLTRAQPQAVVTLYLPTLPRGDLEALRSYAPPDELEGFAYLQEQVDARLDELAPWVDTVWCDRDEDAAAIRATGRFPVITTIPPALAPAATTETPGGPPELVLLATEGHDVLRANEEAVLAFLEEGLGSLRRAVPDLACAVLSERPTPRLETACRTLGAELVPADSTHGRLRSATLVVVPHQHGTGGATAIALALEAGAPFVATARAAQGVDLGGLRALTVAGSPDDLVLRCRRLLTHPDARREVGSAILAHTHHASRAERRVAALRQALATVGITPAPQPGKRWPQEPVPGPARRPLVLATLRPEGWAGEAESTEVPADDHEARYREWVRRFGPTPATLRALADDLRSATVRPLISLLMPVYNTEGWMLREAVASIEAQVYDRWQLCIADDGSDRAETLAILAELEQHPSVRIVRLPGQSGIARATNATLAIAEGEFVAFLDHDDVLKPHALAQVVRWLNADPDLDLIYSDEDKLDEEGRLVQPYLKPDWSPDLLRTNNYVCHLTTIRRSLVEQVGGLRPAFDGSQDYDLILRASELTDRIAHIPEPLYSWRITPGSAAGVADAKPYAIEAGKRAVADALVRGGLPGRVDDTAWIGRHRPRYPILGQPRVSIIIPTKDRRDLLERCVESVLERSSYRNYELVLVDNQTTDGDTLGYMHQLPARTIRYPFPFNYARMVNLAASVVEADAFLFLNNDTEVINEEWIEALLEHAMRPEVGAVGGRLYFGDDQPQHEGIYVGVLGWASNMNHRGHGLLGELVRNTSAVTGACTMVRPSVYWRMGGNDERLRVAYNDVDLCLRIRQAGLEVVYTPHARLYHHESSSRSGYEHREEGPLFGVRWEPRQRVDPYYSPVFYRDAAFRIGLGEPERAMPA